MAHKNNQPNPDDRNDSIEKLQQMVQDTIANMEAAEETAQFAPNDAREQIQEKNERRSEAIDGMKSEIEDEHEDQQKM